MKEGQDVGKCFTCSCRTASEDIPSNSLAGRRHNSADKLVLDGRWFLDINGG